ncbi:MAG TPA: cadherin-like domain-containing protein [Gemmataceae bacterium]|nr:cadherin-like domain-containing protein [Gemmataceae bacterium]
MEASATWRSAPPGRRRPGDRLRVEPLDDRTVPATLLLTTAGDVSGGGTASLNSWTAGTVLQVGGPTLALEPGTTAGTFSALFDINQFADADVNLDGLHQVRRTVTVGTGENTFTLQPGDLLLSIDHDGKTLASLNQLAVDRADVFVFRPQAPGDYSAGTFFPLLDNFRAIHGGGETWAIALVETDTVVGDVTLAAGSFLFSREGGDADNDVRLFVPTGVGIGTTAGSVSVLIDGYDLGIGRKVVGIDLVESRTVVGGRVLTAGTLLLAVDGDAVIGNTAVRRYDVVALTVTRTSLASARAAASATLLFQGSDVGLDGGNEALRDISLATLDSRPSAADDSYTVAEGKTLTGGSVLANDADPGGNTLTAVLVSGPAHGTLNLNPDGSFNYTPAPGFTGTDSFTYRATDGTADSNAVTVTITVRPSGPPPEPPPPAKPPAVDPTPDPGAGKPPPGDRPPDGSAAPGGDSPAPEPVPLPVFTVPVGAVSLGPAAFISAPDGPAFVPLSPPAVAATVPEAPVLPPLPTVPMPPVPGPVEVPFRPILIPPPAVTVVGPGPRTLPPTAEDALDADLAELGAQVQAGQTGHLVTDVTIATGVVATAGYVLLTPKLAFWLLSALLARRTVWKPFDPLEVVCAWEDEQKNKRPSDRDDESLESLVGTGPEAKTT